MPAPSPVAAACVGTRRSRPVAVVRARRFGTSQRNPDSDRQRLTPFAVRGSSRSTHCPSAQHPSAVGVMRSVAAASEVQHSPEAAPDQRDTRPQTKPDRHDRHKRDDADTTNNTQQTTRRAMSQRARVALMGRHTMR